VIDDPCNPDYVGPLTCEQEPTPVVPEDETMEPDDATDPAAPDDAPTDDAPPDEAPKAPASAPTPVKVSPPREASP
jgi:hypothetical protein